MKEIPLRDGYNIIVDEEDVLLVKQYRWYSLYQGKEVTFWSRYYTNGSRVERETSLQKIIMKAGRDFNIKFIDGNRLNFQKSNLELVAAVIPIYNEEKQPFPKLEHLTDIDDDKEKQLAHIDNAIKNKNADSSLLSATQMFRDTWIDYQSIKKARIKGELNYKENGSLYIIRDEKYYIFIQKFADLRRRHFQVKANRDFGLNPFTGLPKQKRGRKSNRVDGWIAHVGNTFNIISGVRGMNDIDLVAKWLAGSVLAFSEMTRRFSAEIISYVARITKDYDLANDISQDVMIKIHNGDKLLDTEKPYRPQIIALAKERLKEFGREENYSRFKTVHFSTMEQRFGCDPLEILFGESDISVEETIQIDNGNKITFTGINADDRELLEMYFIDKIPIRQLAKQLSISERELGSHISRLVDTMGARAEAQNLITKPREIAIEKQDINYRLFCANCEHTGLLHLPSGCIGKKKDGFNCNCEHFSQREQDTDEYDYEIIPYSSFHKKEELDILRTSQF